MTDQPTLYRDCPECDGTGEGWEMGGWYGEDKFCDLCFGDGRQVVEPVGTLTVGYGEMSIKADLLPPGEYPIMPKEADDE